MTSFRVKAASRRFAARESLGRAFGVVLGLSLSAHALPAHAAPQGGILGTLPVPPPSSATAPQPLSPPLEAGKEGMPPAGGTDMPGEASGMGEEAVPPVVTEGYVGAPPVQSFDAIPGRANSAVSVGTLGGVDASGVGLTVPPSAAPAARGPAPGTGAATGLGPLTGPAPMAVAIPPSSGLGAGLGPNMWQGTLRSDVDRDLPRLPVTTGSPVMNDLMRKLLLTGANPPYGSQPNGRSLLAMRLERLTEAGQAELAWQLARNTRADTSPDVSVARARAALAMGEDKAACEALKDIPRGNDPANDATAAFSTKLSAFCQLADGNSEQANLTLDLAREEGYDDPLFSSLVLQAANGLKLKAEEPAELDILDLALYRLAKRDLPSNAGEITETAAVQTLSRDEILPVETRLAAGERAAMHGLIEGVELAALYRLPQFTEEEKLGLKTGTYPSSSIMRRALLFQAIEAETIPAERIRLIRLMLATGKSTNLGLVTAKAILPILRQMTPSPALRGLAPAAVRAFLLVNDRGHARQWYELVVPAGSIASPIAFGRDARELSALMRISDPWGSKKGSNERPDGNPDKASQDGGLGDVASGDDFSRDILIDLRSQVSAIRMFGAREAALLQALGYTMPPEVLQQLSAAENIDSREDIVRLRRASRKGAVGETVMLSLIVLGRGGPDNADRETVALSVSSLKAVNLGEEARRLATEALMGHGYAEPG